MPSPLPTTNTTPPPALNIRQLPGRHSASDYAAEAVAAARVKSAHPGIGGLPIGIPSMDKHLGSAISRGKLLLIAAESGVGKSAFMAQLAAALARNARILSYPFEEDKADFAARLLAIIGSLNIGELREGFHDGHIPEGKLAEAVAYLESLNITISDSHGMSVEEIVVDASLWMAGERASAEEEGDPDPDLVVLVDQVSHITDTARSNISWFEERGFPVPQPGASKHERMEWKARALKHMAAESDCLVALACQLNNMKQGEEPSKETVRDSRGIVHVGDVTLALWRPEFLPDPAEASFGTLQSIYGKKAKLIENTDGITFIKAVKARQIQPFKVELRWDGRYQRLVEVGDRSGEYRRTEALTSEQREGQRKLAEARALFAARREEARLKQVAALVGPAKQPAIEQRSRPSQQQAMPPLPPPPDEAPDA